ncbi:transketolase [Pseudonocardia thermophila]
MRRAAWRIRRRAVDMVAREGFGYLGQALSAAEIFAALYLDALTPDDDLVVSPGHYAIVHYAAGVEIGRIDPAELVTYGVDGSRLESIGTEGTPGLTATCGSLGQGLSVAAGLALGARLNGSAKRVYAVVSDGEMEEGQTWEAALFSAHHGLGNLVVLLDRNDSQVDGPTHQVTTLEPVTDKWTAFGWDVHAVDGHDIGGLRAALGAAQRSARPSVVVAETWTLSGLDHLLPDEADGHFLKVTPEQIEAARAHLTEAERDARTVAPAPWTSRKGERA